MNGFVSYYGGIKRQQESIKENFLGEHREKERKVILWKFDDICVILDLFWSKVFH